MSRRAKGGDAILIVFGLIAAFVVMVVSAIATALENIGSFLVANQMAVLIPVVVLVSIPLVYYLYEFIYFRSRKFSELKNKVSSHINNCNDLNNHISELKSSYVDVKSFDYGSGSMQDQSKFKFKRTHWTRELKNEYVYNCSAAICKNAYNQPTKYLCKYFDIEISETSLSKFESVLNDFAAVEQGKHLLDNERNLILENIKSSIPWLISRFAKKKLIKALGFEEVDLSDMYFPTYSFQYVSPGGNSHSKFDFRLNIENLEKLIFYMRDLIKFAKSIEGQRALMTTSLREKIKNRDNFTCQICQNSTHIEKNLLLEIDHILPLSKGGMTSEVNLQALCWKCNRSKGSKVLATQTL